MFTSRILKSMWSEGGYTTITPLNYQDVMLTPKFPGFVLSASVITHIVVIFNSFYPFMLCTASVSYKELSKLEMPHAVTPIPAIQHQLNDLPPYHRPLHTLKCLQSRLINTFIREGPRSVPLVNSTHMWISPSVYHTLVNRAASLLIEGRRFDPHLLQPAWQSRILFLQNTFKPGWIKIVQAQKKHQCIYRFLSDTRFFSGSEIPAFSWQPAH